MRITFRTLAKLIEKMDDYQKDSDVTVEIIDQSGTECYAGELRIAGDNHDLLDSGHPVLLVDFDSDPDDDQARRDDIEAIATDIGL